MARCWPSVVMDSARCASGMWPAARRLTRLEKPFSRPLGRCSRPRAIYWRRLLNAQNPTTVSIWDVRKGKKIRSIEIGRRDNGAVRSLAFSPGGNLLAFPRACRGSRLGSRSRQRSCTNSAPERQLVGMRCVRVRWEAAGRRELSLSNSKDHAIHLWNMANGKEMDALKGHEDGI